ncbi:MAG: hypothetical protein AAB721_01300 [Patescibacteria group bacterium]
MTNLNHTFGTDPEAFIFKELKRDTKLGLIPNIIPPIALVKDYGAQYKNIKGKKVLIIEDEFQWSEDGAAIELQMQPTDNKDTFWTRLQTAKNRLSNFLQTYELSATGHTPVGFFDTKKYWKNRDEEFQSCVIFGCDPDMFPSQYIKLKLESFKENKELNVSNHKYRYGGGHIHIQAPKNNPEIYEKNWQEASILFDFFAGLSYIINKNTPNITTLELFRLKYYGKPGRIRLQRYSIKPKILGIEYRVLPNTWTNNKEITEKLLTALDISAGIVEQNKAQNFVKEFEKEIPKMYLTLLTLDKKTAKKLFRRCLEWTLRNRLASATQLEKLF